MSRVIITLKDERSRPLKSGDLIKELEADGWVLDRVKGSHHHFRHSLKPGTITVPHPKKVSGPPTPPSAA
ncbi:type II toxin-antitoxin system HicA family toxin [Halomonas sp. HK25]|uniref:type II toxin-antitoxin system HicA family toxin n=1 Tax=Halomonas sp. HK25 TaxID=3394321 RepID=UPI0039FD074F